ncbi:hypothetical protein [Rhizobium sp. ZW T2_16]|uniref:hypothetical protein n=1 Tax=Rhizobium sp. ZW T2_16 TaxID=3378083 RepID=UPI003851CF3E
MTRRTIIPLLLLCLAFTWPPSSVHADPAIRDKAFIQLRTPNIKRLQGIQGVVWVPEQQMFYSTWNRRNGDGSERINVVRHDATGNVIDYSETVGPGSSSPYSLGHGQSIDYLFINGAFTLVTDSGDSRGATFFEMSGSGKGWKLVNVRVYTLQPSEVKSGTVALSVDKTRLIKTGGPYKRGKNVRIWPVAALTAGPQGDRTGDGTPYIEIIQPNLGLPNQGIALDGNQLKFLNGNNLVAGQQSVTDFDIMSKSVMKSSSLGTGVQRLRSSDENVPQIGEPEGMFTIKGAGGQAEYWIGISRKDCSGRGYDTFVVPLSEGVPGSDLPDKCSIKK